MIFDIKNADDFVIERGTSNGWNTVKWNSGKLEAYKTTSFTIPWSKMTNVPIYTHIGDTNTYNLCEGLTEAPVMIGNVRTGKNICITFRNVTATNYKFNLTKITTETITSESVGMSLYLIGKWK